MLAGAAFVPVDAVLAALQNVRGGARTGGGMTTRMVMVGAVMVTVMQRLRREVQSVYTGRTKALSK